MQQSNKQLSRLDKRQIQLDKLAFQMEAQKLRKQYSNKNLYDELRHEENVDKKKTKGLSLLKMGNFLEPTKIIAVSASKWALFDYYTGKYIRGYRSHDINDLSVFSKLLVYCTINTLINKYSLDSTRFDMIVTPGILLNFPDNKTLNADDILSLKDLLTLMVVEESEIYEVVISVNIGAYLFKKSRGEYYSVFDVNDSKMKEHLQLFNDLVNRYSKLLHLEGVVYLQNDLASRTLKSTCCASDVAVLSIECLKIPHFMSIVTSKEHSYSVRFVDQHGELQTRSGVVINKTIQNKYIGYANVCRNWEEKSFMASNCSLFYEDTSSSMRPIVAVLLGCYGPNDREKDIQQLVEWYVKSKSATNKQPTEASELKMISPEKATVTEIQKSTLELRQPSISAKLAHKFSKSEAKTGRPADSIRIKRSQPSKLKTLAV